MHIAVVGASGRSGAALVTQARRRGYDVTAVVRDPVKFERVTAERDVRVAVAELRSVPDLAAAFVEVDAVAFCVGPVKGESGTVQTDGIEACLAALQQTGVKRLVAISNNGMAARPGDDFLTRFVAKPIVQRVLREPFADMARMEERIRASSVEWTVLRPPRLSDKPAKGRYRTNRDGGLPFGVLMTRADLGAAVLDAIADSGTIGATVTVAN